MSLAFDLANAVATLLNTGVVPETHVAKARTKPRRVEATVDQFIDVIPTPQTREIETRSLPDVFQTLLIAIASKIEIDQDENDFSEAGMEAVLDIAEAVAAKFVDPDTFVTVGGKLARAVRTRIGDEVGMMVDTSLLEDTHIALCLVEVQFRVS